MTTMMMLFFRDYASGASGERGTERGLDDSHAVIPPIRPIQIGPQRGGQNFDRRFLSTILDSGTRPYMPGKRATSRVERAIMLLTALKPNRMGAERARLLNKEQRYPFVVSQSVSHSASHSVRDQISCVLHHQLNGKNPSRYLRGSRPLKGTALRAGPRWLHPS